MNQEEIVTEGESVTVKCFSTKSSLDSGVYWFQQTEGGDAKFLVFTSSIGVERNKKDNRFKSSRSGRGYILTFPFKKEDAGIYYCFQVSNSNMEFGTSTKISVKSKSVILLPWDIFLQTQLTIALDPLAQFQ